MDSRRFDTFTRSLARHLPRRGLLRGVAAASASFCMLRAAEQVMAQETDEVSGRVDLPCVPCNCEGDTCDCCLIGITGGGVLRTDGGDVNVILFATQLGEDAPQQAAGFVRWLDPTTEGGLSLESVGPISYAWPEGEEHLRYVHGVMTVNGQGEQPFVLEVNDAGPGKANEDTAHLMVGDAAGGSGSTGFGYEAKGALVGGDIQLLSDVAPIAPAT
jgi:hypothetical protein